MTSKPLTVAQFMTPRPLCLRPCEPLSKARALMRERGIRHVVIVAEDHRIEGVVSERDLAAIERHRDVDPGTCELHEAMMPVVYQVAPDAPLTEVAAGMANARCGSAVVADGKDVVGIFTTTDALRALAQLARGR